MTDEKTYWCPNCQVHAAESATCLADSPPGFMRQRVHNLCDRPVFRSDEPIPANVRVAELRPRGFGKTAEAAETLNGFVNRAWMTHVARQEEVLKEMMQAAIKLVEENPRNEPMRTEIGRPAVERMLAEDLERTGLGYGERVDLAHELFDLGWRLTIDRLVR